MNTANVTFESLKNFEFFLIQFKPRFSLTVYSMATDLHYFEKGLFMEVKSW